MFEKAFIGIGRGIVDPMEIASVTPCDGGVSVVLKSGYVFIENATMNEVTVNLREFLLGVSAKNRQQEKEARPLEETQM